MIREQSLSKGAPLGLPYSIIESQNKYQLRTTSNLLGAVNAFATQEAIMGNLALDLTTARLTPDQITGKAKTINASLPQVDPYCETIVVIPVYKEFSGGRIMATLDDFAGQTRGSERFEVVVVVNNPGMNDPKFNPFAYADNQLFLSTLAAEKQIGKYGNVLAIDCTDGELPARHIGAARGLGSEIAKLRLQEAAIGNNGVVAWIDADTSVQPDFIEQLMDQYHKNPAMTAAEIRMLPMPMDYVSDDLYLGYAVSYMDKLNRWLKNKASIATAGPTISFRARTNPRIYMDQEANEDFILGSELAAKGQLYLLSEPVVYPGDRIRPEGYDANPAVRSAMAKGKVRAEALNEIVQNIERRNGSPTAVPFFDQVQFANLSKTEIWNLVKERLTSDPNLAAQFEAHSAREEELAKNKLDWDRVDAQKVQMGVLLFTLGRMAIGEQGMLAPVAGSEATNQLMLLTLLNNLVSADAKRDKTKTPSIFGNELSNKPYLNENSFIMSKQTLIEEKSEIQLGSYLQKITKENNLIYPLKKQKNFFPAKRVLQ